MKTKLYFIMLMLFCFSLFQSRAQWSPNPTINNPICVESERQSKHCVTTDGAGGMIIAWEDLRNSTTSVDIYAQRIDVNGQIKWSQNGIPISIMNGSQADPHIISDGVGGAIITWRNQWNNNGLYAQRINSNGVSLWNVNGMKFTPDPYTTGDHELCSDGDGGVIIAFMNRASSDEDIFAQRISKNGSIMWTQSGVPLCALQGFQNQPVITSLGTNGAIIAWSDNRNGNWDIFAQRVDQNGLIKWTTNGVPVCTDTSDQYNPSIVAGVFGGAIIAWRDQRSNQFWEIYAQAITANGAQYWLQNGLPLFTNSNANYPVLCSDGNNGAYITWHGGSADGLSAFIQQIYPGGQVGWQQNGVRACLHPTSQGGPQLIRDNLGIIVTWNDSRNIFSDIYAQRISPQGQRMWGDSGIAISIAPDQQSFPLLVSDGNNGAIIAWTDLRSGYSGTKEDIYASRIKSSGILFPVELENFSVIAQGNNLILEWQTATETNNYGFEIQRNYIMGTTELDEVNNNWTVLGFVKGHGTSNLLNSYSFNDSNLFPGKYLYRLKQIDINGAFSFSLVKVISIGSFISNISLSQNSPNPFSTSTVISYNINVATHVQLEVFDLLGRKVATLVDEEKYAGEYTSKFSVGRYADVRNSSARGGFDIHSGVYLYKLSAGNNMLTKKMIIMN